MPYIFCETCRAGFHSNALVCPDCGAPAKRVTRRRAKHIDGRRLAVRENVELEVRKALYGRRSGSVERL
jgi:predicted amidophosphoribosyltransferase